MNRAAVTVAGLVLMAAVAHGQPSSESPRRGGLLPSRPADSAPQFRSRDELARRWDMNADGKIDESEAEVARSKMRRERVEIMQKSQSSLLSKSVDDAAADAPEAEDSLLFPDPAAPPPKTAGAKTDAPKTEKQPTDEAGPQKPTPPNRDLNAGRLPAGLPPARGIPAGAMPPGRGGPGTATAPPTPGMTGGRRPGQMVPPAARATRPAPTARPAPTFPTRPRVTAEEIGGP